MNSKTISMVVAALLVAAVAVFVVTRSDGFSATESVCGWFEEPDDGPRMCFEKDHPDYRYRGTDLPKNATVAVSIAGQNVATGAVDSSGGFTFDFASESRIESNELFAELTLDSGELLALVE